MPDHPSWPAELVEKAAKAIRRERVLGGEVGAFLGQGASHRDMTFAEAVLSALSEDLVLREQAIVRARRDTVALPSVDDLLADEVEVPWSIPTSDSPAIELVPRSQADALAEALEAAIALADEGWDYAEPYFREKQQADAALDKARSALASYRSSSSTETEG